MPLDEHLRAMDLIDPGHAERWLWAKAKDFEFSIYDLAVGVGMFRREGELVGVYRRLSGLVSDQEFRTYWDHWFNK